MSIRSRIRPLLLLLAASAAVVLSLLFIGPISAEAPSGTNQGDNEELARMYTEDQSDRMPAGGAPIDWKVVAPRDSVRLARALEMYRGDQLVTGADYYHVAMILQHGGKPEDYLLAHELCVVAIALGDEDAKWLAAASEDRFLMSLDRPQRFGTQYRSDSPGAPVLLYRYDDGVTDELRAAMDVPSIAKAKAQEASMNEE